MLPTDRGEMSKVTSRLRNRSISSEFIPDRFSLRSHPPCFPNEFGFTAGGPVWLGNLYDGRDKTFWFFTYEGLRTSSSRFNSAWPRVPLDAHFDGDFSELIDGSENPITIYNPFTTTAEGTRDPFPNNQIPSSLFHPFAAKLRAITASPNRPVNPALGNNFEYFYPRTDDTNTFTAKDSRLFHWKVV